MFDLIISAAQPRFKTLPSLKTTGYVGLETRLTCDIVAYPEPKIVWYQARSSHPISDQNPRFAKTNLNNTLIIRNTSMEDAGPYMCRGSNNLGSKFELSILDVKYVGEFNRLYLYNM